MAIECPNHDVLQIEKRKKEKKKKKMGIKGVSFFK